MCIRHTKRTKREVTFVGGRKNRREQVRRMKHLTKTKDKMRIRCISCSSQREATHSSIAATTPHLNTPLFSTFPFKSTIFPFPFIITYIIHITLHCICSFTISVSNNYSSTFMFLQIIIKHFFNYNKLIVRLRVLL